MDFPRLRRGLEFDEGNKKRPYECTAGKTTIGIGHNLTDTDLPEEAIELLYNIDVKGCLDTCKKLFPKWDLLDNNKQYVLANMSFQLGYSNLKKFIKFIIAVNNDDWEEAYIEMLDSKWARSDSPKRAHRLAAIIAN